MFLFFWALGLGFQFGDVGFRVWGVGFRDVQGLGV